MFMLCYSIFYVNLLQCFMFGGIFLILTASKIPLTLSPPPSFKKNKIQFRITEISAIEQMYEMWSHLVT